MRSTRRGFFGLFAGAAISGPKIADEAIKSLDARATLDLPGWETGKFIDEFVHEGIKPKHGHSKSISFDLLKVMGVPEWLKEKWNSEANEVSRFDPDLAAMKSMSLSAKILHQRDRNRKKIERTFMEAGEHAIKRSIWTKIHGEPEGWY